MSIKRGVSMKRMAQVLGRLLAVLVDLQDVHGDD